MYEGRRLSRCRYAVLCLVCRNCIVIAGKTPGRSPRGGACSTRRLALAATHDIQAHARERKGSQQPEGVQISQHHNMALRRNEHADRNNNSEEYREMRRSPQFITLLDKPREELHA